MSIKIVIADDVSPELRAAIKRLLPEAEVSEMYLPCSVLFPMTAYGWEPYYFRPTDHGQDRPDLVRRLPARGVVEAKARPNLVRKSFQRRGRPLDRD